MNTIYMALPFLFLPVLSVSFEQEAYVVSEAEESRICIDTGVQSAARNVSLTLVSVDDTATSTLCLHGSVWGRECETVVLAGAVDFLPIDSTITVFGPPNQTICTPVEVMPDGRVESTERFTVLLNSSDEAVSFEVFQAEVFILDSDGRTLMQDAKLLML